MTTKEVSITEAIDFGWNKFKDNIGLLLAVVVASVLIPSIPTFTVTHLPGFGSGDFNIFAGLFGSLAWLVHYVLQSGLHMGMLKISLSIHDGKPTDFSELFSCFGLIFNYFFAAFVYMAIVIVGSILLIVPGIIWGIKFQFFSFFLVDKNASPMESLAKSADLTKGVKWQLFLFDLVIVFFNMLGVLCLGIGVFFTLAITMLAFAYVYRKLSGQVANQEGPIANP